ncbi:DNA double-strand break repair nuclease NurA [Thermogladius sp.]|uniref:DNA double-strand break repair nuclease NurA n=1 Tax=Thermogladius sp. TaxID=2023064 RepID=UPI003D132FC7
MSSEEEVYVAPEVVYEAVREVAEEVFEQAKGVDEVLELGKELRGKGLINKFPEAREACFYSVDSGYTSPPIEVAGGFIGVIQVAEVLMGHSCGGPPRVVAHVRHYSTRDLTEVEARLLERRALLKRLEEKKEGWARFDIAVVDGELLYRGGVEAEPTLSQEEWLAHWRVAEETKSALRLAGETGTPLVGVLKRSYSRDISAVYRAGGIPINDRLLMSLVLEPGEYFVLGSYRELRDRLAESARRAGGEVARALYPRLEWLERLNTVYGSWAGQVKVVFYKPRLTVSPLAVKVEVYEAGGWGLPEVLAALSGVTGSTGFPTPLDYVDSLAHVRPETRRTVYELLHAELSKRDLNLAKLLMSLVNPQKPV